ncbi:HNH endonuclease [Candidatus Poriferisodalis sp.]|uniref:HNH endonuclease n=1 Tax=Candidatus Poriferisodalis sp. TaxID=3101277 RepID=UPI003B011E32
MPSRWFTNTAQWKRTRRIVLDRDGHRCVDCGLDGALHVHHIVPRHVRPDLIYDPDNCETLCFGCHLERHRPELGPRAKALHDFRDELR